MIYFLIILLFLSVILEGTFVALPLSLLVLVCLTIIRRDAVVFVPAFFAGIFLDVMSLRAVGATSIFFLVFIFLLLLYQRKYEIYSYPFVMTATFLGGLLYLWIFGYEHIGIPALINAVIAVMLFGMIKIVDQRYK